MRDEEKTENHGNDEQEERFTYGAVTYIGAIKARNARLQRARDQFQHQVDWLTGYLFIVNEHLSGTNTIPATDALSYLESVREVMRDLRCDLEDVEHLAGELHKALARRVEREPEAQPSPDPYALLRGWRACMAGTRPSDWEQIVSHLLEDTASALANADAAARKTEAPAEPARAADAQVQTSVPGPMAQEQG